MKASLPLLKEGRRRLAQPGGERKKWPFCPSGRPWSIPWSEAPIHERRGEETWTQWPFPLREKRGRKKKATCVGGGGSGKERSSGGVGWMEYCSVCGEGQAMALFCLPRGKEGEYGQWPHSPPEKCLYPESRRRKSQACWLFIPHEGSYLPPSVNIYYLWKRRKGEESSNNICIPPMRNSITMKITFLPFSN